MFEIPIIFINQKSVYLTLVLVFPDVSKLSFVFQNVKILCRLFFPSKLLIRNLFNKKQKLSKCNHSETNPIFKLRSNEFDIRWTRAGQKKYKNRILVNLFRSKISEMRIQKIFLNAFIACVASGQFINWKGKCKSVPKIKKFNLQKVFCYYFLGFGLTGVTQIVLHSVHRSATLTRPRCLTSGRSPLNPPTHKTPHWTHPIDQ